MTTLDLHRAVKLGLDKSSSLQLPAFEPEELDYWLNEAQIQLVKQKAFGNNFRGEGFEASVKRIDDLQTLVKESPVRVLLTHPFYSNVKYLPMTEINTVDSIYMFFISATVIYEFGEGEYRTIPTELIKQEEINNLIETEINNPYIKHPFIYLYDNKIGVIHDPYREAETDSISIKYIKRPKTLVRTVPSGYETNVCELPEHVHSELVALTVNLLLENIESQRQEGNLFQLSKKE